MRREGTLRLHVLAADGGELQALADTVDVRGGAAWSPDGKWIAVGGTENGQEGLFTSIQIQDTVEKLEDERAIVFEADTFVPEDEGGSVFDHRRE